MERQQIDLRRIFAAQMHSPQHDDDEMVQLREQLRGLEQENDDLQSSVRRSEATQKDLTHQLERAQEQVVFAQQQIESLNEEHEQAATPSAYRELTAKLDEYEGVMDRLLSATGIPNKPQEAEHYVESLGGGTDVTGEETTRKVDGNNLADRSVIDSPDFLSPRSTTKATTTTAIESEKKWVDKVEKLRAELRATTEQLQTTENNYEEFSAASYEVENALVSENKDLKRLVEKLLAEKASLQHLLQAKQNN
ncbi:hypothetical protein PHYPSEUDO_002603 [Phytophthora pseudosyringae]|uniref:Uncharacterized protein n=1 Tax=Phytophthora pseudosyringae TaxID=221518 RepID=A0A8T1VST6_9STRA|nr:hypothetical protein PHYPSEUDO_002603 [Phytophthora pseudosyringae]